MSHKKGRKHHKSRPINFDEFKTDLPPEPEDPEEEEDKGEVDCCDRCLFASLGYILIYVSIFVIFFSERDHKYSQRDISFITSNLQLIDILNVNDSLLQNVVSNQYPVHFVDIISSINDKNMIVMDDWTDLSYPGIALKINTEMYQWIETESTQRKTKDGSAQTQITYSYNKAWSSTFHDSSNFNNKDEYYNPQPTVSKLSVRNIWVDDILIGQSKHSQFHLSKSLYTKLSQRNLWKNVTAKSAEYSEMEMWEIRDGYLYRSYDKAESYYAEEKDKEDDDDDVLKSNRIKLDKPRTLIGDIRMTVFSLDTRGDVISYLGGIKYIEDGNQYVLIPWKSPNNHKFVMLEYGEIKSDISLKGFSNENVFKLWLSRVFTFVFIFIGFMILQSVLQTTIIMLKLPIGPIPFETWTKMMIGAFTVSGILWITVVMIAYIIGIVHLALTFIVLIVIGLLLNNKNVKNEKEIELKTKKKK